MSKLRILTIWGLLYLLWISTPLMAQVPQAFTYQAIARDSEGNPKTDTLISVRFSIRQSEMTGDILYQETHETATNRFGLFTLNLGWGDTTIGNFSAIDWLADRYFLEVEIQDAGTWQSLGVRPFLSVAYALASQQAELAKTAQKADTALVAQQCLNCSSSGANGSVPTGTIVAFGGTEAEVPTGWFLCDGREVSRTQYTDLFQVIKINFGAGDLIETFNVPDLRGQFLRGVDMGAGNDPDTSSRIAMKIGGNTGDNVGSIQEDTLQAHAHEEETFGITATLRNGSSLIRDSFGIARDPVITVTSETGGSETRPKNAYVNFIIKY